MECMLYLHTFSGQEMKVVSNDLCRCVQGQQYNNIFIQVES